MLYFLVIFSPNANDAGIPRLIFARHLSLQEVLPKYLDFFANPAVHTDAAR